MKEADYRLENLGEYGVAVTVDGFTITYPTVEGVLRFLISENVALHPEHQSIADALGVAR